MKRYLIAVLFLLGLASPVAAQEVLFSDLSDSTPGRCFSVARSVIAADTLTIGIESGFDPKTWQNIACRASTGSFSARTAGDTFMVTITAPPGRTIARVHYEQDGFRFLERSLYWYAQGTGSLVVNGAAQAYTFQNPTLVKTATVNAEVAHVLVTLSLQAGRSTFSPRVTAPPGSATIEVTHAVIRVEYE